MANNGIEGHPFDPSNIFDIESNTLTSHFGISLNQEREETPGLDLVPSILIPGL